MIVEIATIYRLITLASIEYHADRWKGKSDAIISTRLAF